MRFLIRLTKSFFRPVTYCYQTARSFIQRFRAAWVLARDPDVLPAFKALQEEVAEKLRLARVSKQVAADMLPPDRHTPRETMCVQFEHAEILTPAEADTILEESRIDYQIPDYYDKDAGKRLAEHLDTMRERESHLLSSGGFNNNKRKDK